MNLSELRMGNYIQAPQGFFSDLPMSKWEITADDFSIINSNPDNYHPIPITSEWLRRFGFKLFNYKHYEIFTIEYGEHSFFQLESSYFELMIQPNTPFYYTFENYQLDYPDVKLDYIHQIQNLFFAITGKELYFQENID